jgi:hypothetical protein
VPTSASLRGRDQRRPGDHQRDLFPLGALFFLGYFFFQIPGAIYAERRSVRKLIICLILWGGCASLTGMVHNIPRWPPFALFRRRRGGGHARDADLHQQLVYQI